jgi:hypothetical protein
MSLNEEFFWKLIDNSREAYSDVDALYEVLADQVWHLETGELKEFQQILDRQLALANTKSLWHAARVCAGDMDEDKFLGFRCWLVSRGKDAFNKAVINPDSMADIPYEGAPLWGDGYHLTGLAGKAWLQWSESDESLPEELPETGIDVRSIPTGAEFSAAELKRAYPRLAAKYNFS